MRVLVCSGRVATAGPVESGSAVARAFVGAGHGRTQAAVIPMAPGGEDLVEALSELGRPCARAWGATPEELAASVLSVALGHPASLLIDLTTLVSPGPDAAGRVLSALGARADRDLVGDPAELRGLDSVDVSSARAALAGVEVVVVAPVGDEASVLTGLDGVASRTLREEGASVHRVVEADEGLAALAASLGVKDAPGVGAGSGAALPWVALGARVASGVDLCMRAAGLDRTVPQADLVVVATDAVTIGDFGGPALLALAPRALEAGVPCLAVAREVEISGRELRQHGVESAQALGGSAAMSASEIETRIATTAASWTW